MYDMELSTKFHRYWTETVGKLYYDKSAWKDLETLVDLVSMHGTQREKDIILKMAKALSISQSQSK